MDTRNDTNQKTKQREMPQRKRTRLKGHDYFQSGLYFVTICTQNRACIFGNIVNGKMLPNKMGEIVQSVWQTLPNHHSVELDQFQIMPNHVHMIIIIVGAGYSRPTDAGYSRPTDAGYSRPTLGNIIAYFKYESTKQINNVVIQGRKTRPLQFNKIFQRNYYEHIIRNDIELNKIREYIKSNPAMWDRDRNNPEN